jgi:hypothetical protein
MCGATAALAQEASFHATATTAFLRREPPLEFISLTGSASQLGAFTGTRVIRNIGHTTIGNDTMIASNGDSLQLYFEVEWDVHFVQASGFYVVTGGTGRFSGATGSGELQVGPLQNGSRQITWDGVIDLH